MQLDDSTPTFSRSPSQLNLDGYQCVDLYERSGPSPGNLGVLILVRLHRPLMQSEARVLDRARESIVDAIDLKDAELDPRHSERAMDQLNSFQLMFPFTIFIEKIPNGYCSQPCCSQIPWYIITTYRGRIKIGWRKRVIVIDWSDSTIQTTAEQLFPAEDSTKDGCMIHAWGYEKAKEYIDKLMERT